MTESTNTTEFATTIQLSTAGIGVYLNTIEGKRLAIIGFRKIVHVWPNSRSSTAISLTLSSIKHKHLVYFTIAIIYILINYAINQASIYVSHRLGVKIIR